MRETQIRSGQVARVTGASGSIGAELSRDPQHLAEVVADAEQILGSVETLVTPAGVDGAPCPTASLSGDHRRNVIDTDLSTVFFTIRAVLPGMIERGCGRIVTVASSDQSSWVTGTTLDITGGMTL